MFIGPHCVRRPWQPLSKTRFLYYHVLFSFFFLYSAYILFYNFLHLKIMFLSLLFSFLPFFFWSNPSKCVDLWALRNFIEKLIDTNVGTNSITKFDLDQQSRSLDLMTWESTVSTVDIAISDYSKWGRKETWQVWRIRYPELLHKVLYPSELCFPQKGGWTYEKFSFLYIFHERFELLENFWNKKYSTFNFLQKRSLVFFRQIATEHHYQADKVGRKM